MEENIGGGLAGREHIRKGKDAKLTEVDKQHIINMLANNISVITIARKLNITRHIIYKFRDSHLEAIDERKQALIDKIERIYEDEITGLATRLVEKGHLMLDHITDDKLKKSNLSQMGITFGIMMDKMRLLTDKSTSNIDLRFSDRDAILKYLGTDKAKEAIDV